MHEKRTYKYRCPTCQQQLQKRGLTAAGTQRWFCPDCHVSTIKLRPDLSRALLLDRFVTWLLGKQSQTELGIPDRTWRSRIDWCWAVVPKVKPTSEIYPIVLLDGIRVGSLVCLIARTPENVIGWRWVGWESSITWSALLEQIPEPTVVVCDGQKGILLAIARCWPESRIQRCLWHVWMNIRNKLTLNPQTEAGQELLRLTRDLWAVRSLVQSTTWQKCLQVWERKYDDFIRERTYFVNPESGHRRWWYTHREVRSAYRQLAKLVTDKQLFTRLETKLTTELIPNTTNHVEGGINSQLRTKLKDHRGLNQLHQQRLVDWYLYRRTRDPKPPRNCL